MKQYEGHADVLVGESDCTAAGKTLCEDLQVQGYPTLKFGDPAALTDYQGAYDLDGLQKFAASELRPACSLSRIELCDAEKRAQLEMLQAMPAEDLNAEIEKSERRLQLSRPSSRLRSRGFRRTTRSCKTTRAMQCSTSNLPASPS